MRELIDALQIFLKYNDEEFPIDCEKGLLIIQGITAEEISEEDKDNLEYAGFRFDEKRKQWVMHV